MNRHRLILVPLLLISLLVSGFYIPRYNIMTADKEVYRYVGRMMLQGGVPYRDVFDHKPPLIYFLNYVGLLGDDWGLWLIDAALALLATFLFYRLGTKHKLALAWLPPLLFNLMLRDHLLCLGIGMTREYTAMLLVFFFYIFMGSGRFRYFGLGALAGLIFFMQQEQVLPLVPFFVYAFLPEKDSLPVWARMLRVLAGFCSILLPLLLYFVGKHALTVFWQDAFLFNFSWYTTTLKASLGAHLIKLKTLLDFGNYEVPFLVAAALGGVAIFFPSKDKKLLWVAILALPLSISNEFMGGRDPVPQVYTYSFSHYVLPLAASIPILLFCVFAFTIEPQLSGAKVQTLLSILLCSSIGYTAIQHGTHLQPLANDPTVASPELQFLRRVHPGDYQFYTFGNNEYIYAYNDLRILAPSPWIYQHFWNLYQGWDPDLAKLRSIEADLLRHRTTYILNFAGEAAFFRNPPAFTEWTSFLETYYVPAEINKNTHLLIWKLKDPTAMPPGAAAPH